MQDAKLAMYFESLDNLKVQCYLCPHKCVIDHEGLGACGVRKNINGQLYSLNYGRIASIALDPIEKKPLNRFHPGSMILSAGTFGCNLKCTFCQNWSIAHSNPRTIKVMPKELIEKAVKMKEDGNIGLAFTYNEPSIWYEYVYNTAKHAKEYGLVNVLVTNGFINKEPLENLLPFIDAMNIDVKGYTGRFYRDICKGALDEVKRTVEISAKRCHIEITTLVIPSLNDAVEEIGEMSKWIASISTEIPLHLSRYFPNYKMTEIPPTPGETLMKARDTAKKYLKYVYMGNI